MNENRKALSGADSGEALLNALTSAVSAVDTALSGPEESLLDASEALAEALKETATVTKVLDALAVKADLESIRVEYAFADSTAEKALTSAQVLATHFGENTKWTVDVGTAQLAQQWSEAQVLEFVDLLKTFAYCTATKAAAALAVKALAAAEASMLAEVAGKAPAMKAFAAKVFEALVYTLKVALAVGVKTYGVSMLMKSEAGVTAGKSLVNVAETWEAKATKGAKALDTLLDAAGEFDAVQFAAEATAGFAIAGAFAATAAEELRSIT